MDGGAGDVELAKQDFGKVSCGFPQKSCFFKGSKHGVFIDDRTCLPRRSGLVIDIVPNHLTVDRLYRLHEGGGRDAEQAGIGLAEFDDHEDRKRDADRPEGQSDHRRRTVARQQAIAEE